MSGYSLYVFFLCLIVFVLLVTLSVTMLTYIVKLTIRLIRLGDEDEKIKAEYELNAKKKKCGGFDCLVSIVLCAFMLAFFAFSLYVNLQTNSFSDTIPTFRVVNTGSMSKKHEKNTYLEENGLNDQFATFDLILTYKLPEEKDLQLYDIVVYEVDGSLIVHRIVSIQEPNAAHPNERFFLLQGDAVESPDRFPVLYSQMRAIYRGQHVPFIGSFVSFMQSPAGWLCVLLVVGALIATPIIEKILNEEKRKRLLAMGLLDEESAEQTEEVLDETPVQEVPEELPQPVLEEGVQEEPLQEQSGFALNGKRDMRTFREKLSDSPQQTQDRYYDIISLLNRIEGVRIIEGRKFETYKCGNVGVIRFALRGKTLNAFIGLNPAEYAESKYVFTDVSTVKAYKHYPMRMKATSDRQTKWIKELLFALVEKNGWTLLEEAIEPEIEYDKDVVIAEDTSEPVAEITPEAEPVQNVGFALNGKRDMRTFREKLNDAPEQTQERYRDIISILYRIDGVRIIEGRKFETYKCGNVGIVRFALRGKTLNAFIGLNPAEYAESKYVFIDVSSVKAYKHYPMRMKATSDRQTKWIKELLFALAEKNGWTLLEEAVEPEIEFDKDVAIAEDPVREEPVQEVSAPQESSPFARLKGKRDTRTFREKLEQGSDAMRERYASVVATLARFTGIRVIESKKHETYKCGNTPVARVAVRGKTLNVYLALNPAEYAESKYVFTDVSNVKAHALYPVRMKLSSARQTRWVCELLEQLALKRQIALLQESRVENIVHEAEDPFAHLRGRSSYTFKQKLAKAPKQTKERYREIVAALEEIQGVRIIESKRYDTYKRKSVAIVKITLRGKTINVYLALDPKEYEDSKYIFTDVSDKKAFASYPMRVKVTSDRQVRWTRELIAEVIKKYGLPVREDV